MLQSLITNASDICVQSIIKVWGLASMNALTGGLNI